MKISVWALCFVVSSAQIEYFQVSRVMKPTLGCCDRCAEVLLTMSNT